MSRRSENTQAMNLAGQHIGDVIRWTHDLGSGRVHAVLTGELRQVYHTAGETVLNVCSAVYDTSGSMEEYVLDRRTRVEILGTDEVAEFRHTS